MLAPAHAPVFAEINGVAADRTGSVETVNPVLLSPAGTVTCDGTLAEAEELDRLTGWPPAGAGLVRATLPLTLLPPITVDLERLMEPTQSAEAAAGFTVRLAEAVFADDAVMVAVAGDETVEVLTGNEAALCPAGIVTEAGTVAA